jgi:hypothetical protein
MKNSIFVNESSLPIFTPSGSVGGGKTAAIIFIIGTNLSAIDFWERIFGKKRKEIDF